MSQVSVFPTTAHGRSSWRALRPLLLLGGFVALWWALMTGVAQADSSPKHLVDHVRSQVTTAHHDTAKSPVREVVRRVHHEVKTTATKTTSTVRQQTKPVTRSVSTVVEKTPVVRAAKPAVHEVEKTVRSSVADTVEKTRSVLSKTLAGPVVDGVVDAADSTVETAESAALQGDSPSPSHSAKSSTPSATSTTSTTSTTTTTDLAALASGEHPDSSEAPSGERASHDADAPVDGPAGTPPVHDPCASPSGSSTTSTTPAGITESSTIVMPQVGHDLHVGRLARLLDGPAYEPGSSPD